MLNHPIVNLIAALILALLPSAAESLDVEMPKLVAVLVFAAAGVLFLLFLVEAGRWLLERQRERQDRTTAKRDAVKKLERGAEEAIKRRKEAAREAAQTRQPAAVHFGDDAHDNVIEELDTDYPQAADFSDRSARNKINRILQRWKR
jgi:hypothetical protein